ncbi:MAG TPA: hypothetical protein VD971_00560 [Phycisphaerales bacterium]|nr:hypothetical protein [Phycisphaerales bacterium]
MRGDDDRQLAAAWRIAAENPAIAGELGAVYEGIRADVMSRGPACWASGRCCNFEKTGHRLYVTGLEAAFTLLRAPRRDAGRGTVSLAQVGDARRRGDCPFLEGNACGVHESKPVGCRVYFCDRSATGWQEDLSERALARVRAIHDRYGVPYRYGEWRGMLELLAEDRRNPV